MVMNQSIPLIDEKRFLSSLSEATTGNKMGKFVSQPLLNALLAITYMGSEEYKDFKSLATQQVNIEILKKPSITTVQTLLLISIMEMSEGEEFCSSDFMARAVSVSYHLGLHVSNKYLVSEGKLTLEEGMLRDNVFWCVFLVDRIRSIVLGMHPLHGYIDTALKTASTASRCSAN